MHKETALKTILLISIGGVLFSGVLSYIELFKNPAASCPSIGAPGTILGYPACVYGFFMYLLVVAVSIWGLMGKRKRK